MPTLPIDQTIDQALAHQAGGRLKEAEQLYRKVLAARPRHPEANHNLGVLLLEQNRMQEALQHLKIQLGGKVSLLEDAAGVQSASQADRDRIVQSTIATLRGALEKLASLAGMFEQYRTFAPSFLDEFLAPEGIITKKRDIDSRINANAAGIAVRLQRNEQLAKENLGLRERIEEYRRTLEGLRVNLARLQTHLQRVDQITRPIREWFQRGHLLTVIYRQLEALDVALEGAHDLTARHEAMRIGSLVLRPWHAERPVRGHQGERIPAFIAPGIGGLGGSFDAVSRESMLLGNNVLLAVACGTVLLGTLYPLFLDALGLGKISVGPPYFDRVFVPVMAPLVFLMGVGPIARWKKAALPDLWARLKWALMISLVLGLLLPFVGNIEDGIPWSPMAAFGYWMAAWVVLASIEQIRNQIRHAPGSLPARLAAQPRGWWGMTLAHLGVAVFIIGVTSVRGYEVERDVKMAPGDTVSVHGYTFRFEGVGERRGPNFNAARGTVALLKNGKQIDTLHPEKRVYFAQSQMPMTEASIRTGITGDVYVSLGEPVEPAGSWTVRVYYKPFVTWIWGGCVLMALGGFLAASDRRYRALAIRQQAAATGRRQPAAA